LLGDCPAGRQSSRGEQPRGPAMLENAMTKVWGGALIAALMAAPLTARADEAPRWTPTCLNYAEARAAGERAAALDPEARFFDFGGADAADLLKAINDEPPRSEIFAGERILVLERPGKDIVEFGVVRDGCFIGPGKISESVWSDLKRAAFGERL
jgi:hypothetical protein